MVKPLFAPRVRRGEACTLNRSHEPLVFAFVERVCQAVGAPVPRRIDVDCEVNASASFRRGLLSLFGRDLVLTIGLPLVMGLSLRQLAGVLAHEFGHFTQGFAMRLTYIIRSVNGWFARVVYERDSWDEQLVAWSNRATCVCGFAIPCAAVRVADAAVLWALMMAGHVISCWMLRQMEFDADRHQARWAGSDAFAPAFERMEVLAMRCAGRTPTCAECGRNGRSRTCAGAYDGECAADSGAGLGGGLERGARTADGMARHHPANQERIENAQR